MIGLDSNVIVRHLTDDDPDQSPKAHAVFDSLTPPDPAHISLVALVETHWVLRQAYTYSRAQVIGALRALVTAADIAVESNDLVVAALDEADRSGHDLPDILIARSGAAAGCSTTVTFDRQASTLPGMTELR
ncbi:MAG: type II toxin-antitoxin system VapC family toxin [Propionibacteriaceae bacterium]|nr:type II toxin-antitoxin system VapC family toxin [Propionibacteriaceae bacterium]